MSESTSESRGTVACPLCGSPAEQGCVYGAHKGFTAGLRWYPGPPGFLSNLATQFGGGEAVGGWEFGTGSYAEAIRCDRCRRIILSY